MFFIHINLMVLCVFNNTKNKLMLVCHSFIANEFQSRKLNSNADKEYYAPFLELFFYLKMVNKLESSLFQNWVLPVIATEVFCLIDTRCFSTVGLELGYQN